MNTFRFLIIPIFLVSVAHAELRVPSSSAYALGPATGVSITENGVTNWKGGATKIVWYGKFDGPGSVDCKVVLGTPLVTRLRLTVDGVAHEAVATADPPAVSFGPCAVKKAGFIPFILEAEDSSPEKVETLVLNGAGVELAHFNTLPRRNTASVHLNFTLPEGKYDAFYGEATAVTDPVATYYEVVGFNRGYFGMQVNSETERRIIFSVWDSGSGKAATTRAEVDPADQTALLSKGEGVQASAFGHEGTGGHSHLSYRWKTGEKQRFLVVSKAAGEGTAIFSGYYFHPEKRVWMLIASFKAPKASPDLSHFYAFSENFDGANGDLRRRAQFQNQWVHSSAGQWLEITRANFTTDSTGREMRLDREAGVENGSFFLASGGFTGGTTKSGETIDRPATNQPPADLDLAKLPR